jgi:hypothetical protein
MSKVARGRISGQHRMQTYTAEELREWASVYTTQATCKYRNWSEDPAWLLQWAGRIASVASKKEKSREHKLSCRRGLRSARQYPRGLAYSGFGIERIFGGSGRGGGNHW